MGDTVLIGAGFIGGFCTGCVMALLDELFLYLKEKRRKKDEEKK